MQNVVLGNHLTESFLFIYHTLIWNLSGIFYFFSSENYSFRLINFLSTCFKTYLWWNCTHSCICTLSILYTVALFTPAFLWHPLCDAFEKHLVSTFFFFSSSIFFFFLSRINYMVSWSKRGYLWYSFFTSVWAHLPWMCITKKIHKTSFWTASHTMAVGSIPVEHCPPDTFWHCNSQFFATCNFSCLVLGFDSDVKGRLIFE